MTESSTPPSSITQLLVDARAGDRQAIDALRTQLISAQAALEARKSELIRARAAVKNAETRLRTLINAPMLAGDPEAMELRPLDRPTTNDVATDLFNEFTIAMQNRPEVAAALKQIRAASVRLRMADNEVLPMLNENFGRSPCSGTHPGACR